MQVEAEPPSSPESLEREENRGCALSTRPAGPHTASRRNHRADPQAKGKSRSTQSKRRGLETGASNTQKRFEISSGFAFSHCSVPPSPPAVAGPSRITSLPAVSETYQQRTSSLQMARSAAAARWPTSTFRSALGTGDPNPVGD